MLTSPGPLMLTSPGLHVTRVWQGAEGTYLLLRTYLRTYVLTYLPTYLLTYLGSRGSTHVLRALCQGLYQGL